MWSRLSHRNAHSVRVGLRLASGVASSRSSRRRTGRCDPQDDAVAAALPTDFCRAVAIHVQAPCLDSVLEIACKRFEAACLGAIGRAAGLRINISTALVRLHDFARAAGSPSQAAQHGNGGWSNSVSEFRCEFWKISWYFNDSFDWVEESALSELKGRMPEITQVVDFIGAPYGTVESQQRQALTPTYHPYRFDPTLKGCVRTD
jgi:hypothetical protein